jgi:hypothetical protein
MKTLPAKTQRVLAELEREARRAGVEHHLRAARELAKDNLPTRQIQFMTRWLFSKEAIAALRAEARASQRVNTTR